MSEEFSIDVDKKSIEELKKAINYDEIEARHQRFMKGIETEDDLINGIYHYKIQNDKGLDLDVVEMKYYNKIIELYQKEKEKNKELNDMNFKVNYNLLKTAEQLENLKDKIKEKIEEYKKARKPYWEKNQIQLNFIDKDKAKITREELQINDTSMELYGGIKFGESLLQ